MTDHMDRAVEAAKRECAAQARRPADGMEAMFPESAVKAAIQAAVKVLVSEERAIPKYMGNSATGATFYFAAHRDERVWNACRAEILKNAGVE